MLVTKAVVEEGTVVVCEECGKFVEEGEEIVYVKIGDNETSQICEDCADTLKSELHDNLF